MGVEIRSCHGEAHVAKTGHEMGVTGLSAAHRFPFRATDEIDDRPGIQLGVVFENIVSAPGENGQLAPRQAAIKGDALLGLEKMTPVRIHHQGWAGHVCQLGPQIERFAPVASAVAAAEGVEPGCPLGPVPVDIFFLDVGRQVVVGGWELNAVQGLQRHVAETEGAGRRQGFDPAGVAGGEINPHHAAFALPQDVKSMAPEIFRHRILLSYEAEAEGKTTDDIVDVLLERVEVP